MRVKEMHPLCCITLESPRGGIGDRSPDFITTSTATSLTRARSLPLPTAGFFGSDGANAGSSSSSSGLATPSDSAAALAVAGVLYKWTNFGKGWRSRWFLLNKKDGSLAYSKTCLGLQNDDVHLIGEISRRLGSTGAESFIAAATAAATTNRDIIMNGLSSLSNCSSSGRRDQKKTDGIIQLKISSFRESKSDDKKFYIFTATKCLHLRTDSKGDRLAWIQALVSARSLLPSRSLTGRLSPVVPNDLSISTERLKKRLLEEGIDGKLVKDCEQIVLSEFNDVQGKFKVLCEERSNLLTNITQLEAANIEAEASGIPFGEYQLTKHEFSSLGHVKYSECSTAESSEEIEKQEVGEGSDEDETSFYDATDYFSETTNFGGSIAEVTDNIEKHREPNQFHDEEKMHSEMQLCNCRYPQVERRKKLPNPVEKEKSVSLWSLIKDNVGKDLTRVCLPVFFNEPISSLQKCFEELEYSHLLDRAYEYGKAGDSLLRILNVAAFAVSGYASSKGRHCKPFNPLLGETYEADYPEKGVRFFSEKVSHHPTLIACHCEGRGWKFWGDSNLHSKFWGQSIQLDPVGDLTLEFDDGEIFQWNKVTTTIHNLILGKLYCDHHGMMHIRGNREYSCKLRFKEQSILDRNPYQVHGFVEDILEKKVATLFGKWDENMYYVNGEVTTKMKGSLLSSSATLLWQSAKPPPNLTRYNLTSFAITLNELTPGLQEKLPPTDSRLRPDQRHLENGEYEKANAEKQRLEKRQRMSRKLQEHGWTPRWFQKEDENGTFRYVGGYWEAREEGNWDGCPDIFGEFKEGLVQSSEGS